MIFKKHRHCGKTPKVMNGFPIRHMDRIQFISERA